MFGLAILAVALWPASGFSGTNILNIRHWAAPDHTRIVIDTSEEAQYRVVKEQMRLSVTIENSQYVETRPATIVIKKPGIEKIAVSAPGENQVLVELFLTAHTETKVFRVRKFEGKPDRIVIDIILPEVEKKDQEDRERVKEYTKDKIVVIDPGHGGEDPGAVGRNGTQEKKVVLEISKKVRDKLNAREGYYAFLTREGDYYVSFKKRLQIAREYGADLFLSIHADASRSRRVSGSSIYALSLRGASNEAAKILARNENLADIVGGTGNGEAIKDISDPIILNMFQTNTMNSSKIFGNLLLKNMVAINRIKFNTVQEAPFMVLKLPEVPSILVETAYISNPAEEKKLRSRKFQNELAEIISDSAVEFLSTTAPVTPVVPAAPLAVPPAVVKKEETPPAVVKKEAASPVAREPAPVKKEEKKLVKASPTVFHMVKRGESVDRIAKKYRVSPAQILKANDMKPRDPLYANRKIIIPVKTADRRTDRRTKAAATAEEDDKPAMATATYKVKKGDSLDSIAVKHGTNYLVLLKINGMKEKDTLYAGKKIKVPAPPEAAAEKEQPPGRKQEEKPAPATPLKYRVKEGDTLEKIAARQDTTIASLLELNRMKLRDHIYPGQVIVVRRAAAKGGDDQKTTNSDGEKKTAKKIAKAKPRTVIYVVKKGDSLDAIARKHKTTVSALRDLNPGKRLSPLYVDQRLKIPGSSRM